MNGFELNTVNDSNEAINLKKISMEYVTTGRILSKTITRLEDISVEFNRKFLILHCVDLIEFFSLEIPQAGSPTNNPDVTKCATNWFKLYKELRAEDITSIETSRYQL
nr:13476_t:CDS:2 [Entrophospora candida]